MQRKVNSGKDMIQASEYEKLLEVGRPENIKNLFPNSQALIVSGKIVNQALAAKGNGMTIAANGRNDLVIEGTLRAAHKANSAVIIEIAKSEAGYCPTTFANIASIVDTICNKNNIQIPVAVHADHYGIKNEKDFEKAKKEIPEMFKNGVTSIAIDASHLPNGDNLLTNISLSKLIPSWAGYETEVGEIKGDNGLSTPDEALFLIQGLNAHAIFPDWIALNNGTTHGIEKSSQGIQVELTKSIHTAIQPYGVNGAQHGTSGNSFIRLRDIAKLTNTTKANVATALQFISWGIEVDEYGNAKMDENGEFIKDTNKGLTNELWAEMVAYAKEQGWKSGDYKNLNKVFDEKIKALSPEIRERMVQGVESFVYYLLTEVFYAQGSAAYAYDIIKKNDPALLKAKKRIEKEEDWTKEKIIARAAEMFGEKQEEEDSSKYDD